LHDVEDGGRQITAFHIAGDFVDLHSFLLKPMDHGITAMTELKVMTFPHDRLEKITEKHAHLTRLLWLNTLLDGAIHRQWLVVMGRTTGASHLAHFFCEHFLRAKAAGLTDGMTYPLPIAQTDLADALGLSAVHTNRVLGELRPNQLIAWDKKTVRIIDWNRLQEFAMFDPTYLHLKDGYADAGPLLRQA
jgi:CRP-like cAMP-binding protein